MHDSKLLEISNLHVNELWNGDCFIPWRSGPIGAMPAIWQSRTCGGAENEMHSEHSEQNEFSAVA